MRGFSILKKISILFAFYVYIYVYLFYIYSIIMTNEQYEQIKKNVTHDKCYQDNNFCEKCKSTLKGLQELVGLEYMLKEAFGLDATFVVSNEKESK